MSLQRVKAETTSTEFVKWKVRLDKEVNNTTADQFYFAQLAQEIRRLRVKHPERVKLKEFQISFNRKQQVERVGDDDDDEPDEETLARDIDNSKAYWMGLAGYERK